MSWLKTIGILVTLIIAALPGCSTKQYGRQGQLTNYEREYMSCHDIDLEMAKVRGFIDHVNNESKFSGKDVLAILGDLGIGNVLERDAALESANKRLVDLGHLKAVKNCMEQEAESRAK